LIEYIAQMCFLLNLIDGVIKYISNEYEQAKIDRS